MIYTGAELIVEFLHVNGYKHVFGIPGRRILSFFDAVNRAAGKISMITTRHEQGAAFMAEVYSRLNSKGCCIGISAPGAINLLAGAAAAYMDSIPLLILGGQAQVADMGKYPVQEATGIGRTPDQLQIYKSTTKYAVRVEKIKNLPYELEKAYKIMNHGRKGPVYIELPTNILDEKIEYDIQEVVSADAEKADENMAEEIFAKAANILVHAKKPLLLLGNGVQIAGAEKEYESFLSAHELPYVTTLLAKGILDEVRPLSLGTIGIFGQKSANKYLLDEADAVIAVGTSFQELSSMVWREEIAVKLKIRVDIDTEELGRNYQAENKCLMDAGHFITGLAEYMRKNRIRIYKPDAVNAIKNLKRQYGYFSVDAQEYDMLHPGKVIEKINKLVQDEDIVISDIGENGYWSSLLIQRRKRGTYILNCGYGSMGHGVAGAIGAALTEPKGRVIAVCGDGGFLMNGNEVATASFYKVQVIWCVLDNGILGTQKHFQEREFEGRVEGSNVPDVDICKYAQALGARAFLAGTMDEFEKAYQLALSGEGPAVIDIKITDKAAPKPQCDF